MERKRINLALQGGGAFGAFTWGVLDRLLREPWLEVAAISGTSAGALNGAAVKAGLARGKVHSGRRLARENLDWLWSQVGEVSDLRLDRWLGSGMPAPEPMRRWVEAFTPTAWMDMAQRVISPYDSGPFYINPLERVVRGLDFSHVCAEEGPAFFVGATNVRTGRLRVFSDGEVTAETLLASACLPNLFRAVEIKDPETGNTEAYWDGGFTGNPPLFPLLDPKLPRDIVIVSVFPLERENLPQTPLEIDARTAEIAFNAALLSELRAISTRKRLIAEKRVPAGSKKDVLIHMIADDPTIRKLAPSQMVAPAMGTLAMLRSAGEAAADAFLDKHADDIGTRATLDVPEL